MTPGNWQRILDLFHRMLDDAEPERLLAEEPDATVRAEAQRLFAHHHRAEDGFLRAPLDAVFAAAAAPRFTAGSLLAGRFRIVRLAGTGGMGEVYEAEDLLLKERVALKTIRGGHEWDQEFAARFLREVQSARRVTHHNVCRIHECFQDSAVLFLSMEFIEGATLGTLLDLDPPGLSPDERAEIALQAGHAVAAIHDRGLIHGDLKPGNILVERPTAGPLRAVITDFGLAGFLNASNAAGGGTHGFLAPEVAAGGPPSIASDLYAFGRILELLTPGDPFAQQCRRASAGARPGSVRAWSRMRSEPTWRRTFLWSIAAVAVTATPLAYLAARRSPLQLTSRERALLNPLEGDLGQSMQPYVEYCIRQSSVVGLVSAPPAATLELSQLFAAARARKARLAFAGDAARSEDTIRLRLTAYEVPSERRQADVQLSGPAGTPLARLAGQAVRQIRLALGESGSLVASNWDPAQTASPSAQAVILYFDAIQKYEAGEPLDALRLFDEAIRYDPEFPLAHFGRARALSNLSREPEALEACGRAMTGRGHLARPQQLSIEALHSVLVNRLDEAAGLYRRLLLLEPEQAAWHRQYANVAAISGRPEDAIASARQAVDTDPAGQMNWSALALLQAEAGHAGEALTVVTQARERGLNHPTLLWGEAEARAVAGHGPEGLDLLRRMTREGPYERLARHQASLLEIWLGRLREAALDLETDIPRDEAEAHSRWAWERRLRLAQITIDLGDRNTALRWLLELPEPPDAPLYAGLYRSTAVLAAQLGATDLVRRLSARLGSMQQRWPSTTTEAALCHVRAAQSLAGLTPDVPAARNDLARGYGLLPDAAMTLDFARVLRLNRELEAAQPLLKDFDRFLGTLLQRDYPGLAIHAWLERAELLQLLNQPAEAVLLYGKVVNQWPPASGARAAQTALLAMAALQARRIQ
ncbi:MAG: protein kinase [Paludibaculum sp.]